MREAVIILAVILLLLGITAFRYRRQLLVGYQIWKTLKAARRPADNEQPRPKMPKAEERMVKCIRCGTWTPQSSAIVLGSSTYCSAGCVERSAKT